MSRKYDWRPIPGNREGHHKLFFDGESKGMAVADDSGPFPHLTEDGVLWVRVQGRVRPTTFGVDKAWTLPLLDERGEPCSTIASDYTITRLLELGWVVT